MRRAIWAWTGACALSCHLGSPDAAETGSDTTDGSVPAETDATLDGDSSASDDGAEPPDHSVGRGPILRLTQFQYAHAIEDIFGIVVDPTEVFSTVQTNDGIGAPQPLPADAEIRDVLMAAEAIAATIAASPGDWVACGTTDLDCALAFADIYGRRLFRRALEPDETAALASLYQLGSTDDGPTRGFELVVATLLQSPHFLYRVELGEGEPQDGVVALAGTELATRISLFLTDSLPDESLLAAAEQGELTDAAELAAHVDRLLETERGRAGLAEFFVAWTETGPRVEQVFKDPAVYPLWSAGVATAARLQALEFFSTILEHDGDLLELLTSPRVVVDAALAPIYGVVVDGDAVEIEVDHPRFGLFTLPAFLAVKGLPDHSDPVRRGLWVREALLCQPLPDPPPGVMIEPPSPDPDLPTRELYREHSANPACAGCHALMDPIGFAFEHYDSAGAYRSHDGGMPVDASGEVTGVDGETASFADLQGLVDTLAASPQVRRCTATQMFRHALARMEDPMLDANALMAIDDGFVAASLRLKALPIAIVMSESFRHRRLQEQP